MAVSKESLNYATRNLLNRKVRSGLTILSIFVGITTIFIFISFGWGLYNYVEELSVQMGVDKLMVQTRGLGAPGTSETFVLDDDDLNVFRKTRGISQAAGMAFSSAKVEHDDITKYKFLIGMPTEDKEEKELFDEWFESVAVDINEGRNLEKGDKGKVVLGYNYKVENRLYDKPLKLNDKIEINDVKYKIIGFYDEVGNPSDDGQVYMTEEDFLTATGKEEITYGILVGKADNTDRIEEIKERAEKNLRKERGLEEGKEDFFIQTASEMIEAFGNALNIVIGFITLIALISVVVSAVNTSNTMFTSILERTKEIGVLKAVGATNYRVLEIFLLEAGLLGMTAGIIGVICGIAFTNIADKILHSLGYGFLSPHYSWQLFLALILFATLVGGISGIVPAYNASKKNPVDSLRYE